MTDIAEFTKILKGWVETDQKKITQVLERLNSKHSIHRDEL
jgi:hypothetical protein